MLSKFDKSRHVRARIIDKDISHKHSGRLHLQLRTSWRNRGSSLNELMEEIAVI